MCFILRVVNHSMDRMEVGRKGTRMGEEEPQMGGPLPSWASAEAFTTEARGSSLNNAVTVTGRLG